MNDTIVALSSPPVSGTPMRELQLAIIRVSGPRAFEFADGVFNVSLPEAPRAKRRDAAQTKPPAATLVEAALEKRWRRLAGQVVWRAKNKLNAHAYVMPAPRSYTRENVVELHVPGLPWLVDELLDALLAAGARVAQPGEFTRRAFENGRLSLEQAEAVARLVSSSTAAEARAHVQRLVSHVERDRQKLKAGLEELLSKVELGLDFAHEDVVVIAPEEIEKRINELRLSAEKLSADVDRDAAESPAQMLPRIVLAGPTNAGKSRLFNVLLKRDAAIVSAQRHTTRDCVEAPSEALGAILVDSAGSGVNSNEPHSPPPLYAAAWSASRRAIRTADLLLLALDRAVPLDAQEGLSELLEEIESLKEIECALVWTKGDLPGAHESGTHPQVSKLKTQFTVSALSGAGIVELRAYLAERVAHISRRSAEAHSAADGAFRAAARSIAESLAHASEALRDGSGEDALAVELREAIHACWQAEGILIRHDAVTENALDKIFAQFCIGK